MSGLVLGYKVNDEEQSHAEWETEREEIEEDVMERANARVEIHTKHH